MPGDEERTGRLDWAGASVEDGELSLPVRGEPSKSWAKDVARIAEQLRRPGNAWGTVAVTRKKVTVASVTAGAEEELHHLLEAAVLQANADHATPADRGGDAPATEDVEMAERFRGFADAEVADDGGS